MSRIQLLLLFMSSSSKAVKTSALCGARGGGGKNRALFMMDVSVFYHNVMCSARFWTSDSE